MAEKRSYTRINGAYPVDIIPIGQSESIKGIIVNISACGIGIVSIHNVEIPVNTTVYVNLILPSCPEFKNIEGTVTRIENISDKHYLFVAINLTGLPSEQKTILNQNIMYIQHKHYTMKLGL